MPQCNIKGCENVEDELVTITGSMGIDGRRYSILFDVCSSCINKMFDGTMVEAKAEQYRLVPEDKESGTPSN